MKQSLRKWLSTQTVRAKENFQLSSESKTNIKQQEQLFKKACHLSALNLSGLLSTALKYGSHLIALTKESYEVIKWHTHLIAIYALGDDNELGVSF